MKKGFFIILSFSVLALLQVSFLPHFLLWGWTLNLVLIFLVILASFASFKAGIEAALAGGFFLDIYSSLPFGFWLILSLMLFFLVRYIFRNYVRIPQYI